jgi:hypothetical protein
MQPSLLLAFDRLGRPSLSTAHNEKSQNLFEQLLRVGLVLMGVLLLTQIGRCQNQPWRKFSSVKGGFSVLLPGKPQEEKDIETTPEGNSTNYRFIVEHSSGSFTAGYTDMAPAHGILPTRFLLDNFRDGMFEELDDLVLLGEKNIALKNNPGRAITFRGMDGLTYSSRIYRVKRRIYYLLAVTIPGFEKRSAGAVQKFLNSLTVSSASQTPVKPPIWRQFSPSSGRFAVLMPGQPTQKTVVSKLPQGLVRVRAFTLIGELIGYAVMYQDVADPQISQRVEQTFDAFQRGMLAGINRKFSQLSQPGTGLTVVRPEIKIFGQRSLSLQEWPGREIRFRDPSGMSYKVRFYLVQQRIYVMSVSTARENEALAAKDSERFFGSLTILNPLIRRNLPQAAFWTPEPLMMCAQGLTSSPHAVQQGVMSGEAQ